MASLKDVVFKLRDVEPEMKDAWTDAFHFIRRDCNIEVIFIMNKSIRRVLKILMFEKCESLDILR